jgi:hypothetical protein
MRVTTPIDRGEEDGLGHLLNNVEIGLMTMTTTYFERLSQLPTNQQLTHLISGGWIAQAIGVAAELGIADLLADGPRSSDDLAQATGSHPRALYRLLRALASMGVFTEVEPKQFGLTPMAELLRTDAPTSLRGRARFTAGDAHWRVWGQLGYSVQANLPAYPHVHGMSNWEYRAQHPEANALFNASAKGNAAQVAGAVARAYDFTAFSTVIDVGGGLGTMLIAILQAHPGSRGVLFDQLHVTSGAEQAVRTAGLSERCDVVDGDMFAQVPDGGDAYVLSRVIHDWDDERSIAILTQCRRVIEPHARLLLIEEVILPGDTPSYGKLTDLNMLVAAGGQERTEAEYRELYEAAGFRLARIIPTGSPMSIIEGEPV